MIEVGAGGGYFDASRVLWDERTDGPLPAITLGGMVLEGDALVFSQARMDEHTGAAIASTREDLVKQIDADTDSLYAAVIGNRAAEYTVAETEATAYAGAGYTGAVPASVASWATAKGWTAQQAADDINATAAAWRTAQAAIRAARLLRKEQARTAADLAALNTVQAQWAGFVAVIRGQLGI